MGELESIVMRFAEPRELPIKLLATCEEVHGHAFGAELRQWIHLFERYELEVCDPARAELRMPSMHPTLRGLVEQQSPSWISDLIGYLTASSVVIQQDEMSYLASWNGERSKILYFHPNDWGLWPTEGSLYARLCKLVMEDHAVEPEVALPRHLDPSALFPRADWMVHALLGVGRELARELERASAMEVWKRERELLEGAPHLSIYWIWSHYLLDNIEALEELLELSAGENNGVFADSRDIVVSLLDDRSIKLGDRNNAAFAELKQKIESAAPIGLFGEEALGRRKKREEEASSRSNAEALALAELTARADNEPRIKEAIALLEHLSRGGASRPAPTDAIPLDADAAMARLYELVDRRFGPLLEARLKRAALFADTHREAAWGLLLAFAAITDDIAEFESMLERTGTKNFGPRRMTELYRAYSTFADKRATQILALGAKQWLEEVDDWIRMTPAEPVLRLLERDVLETHEMIAAVLERATFSGANQSLCVVVARAAGELRSRRAIKGLERAVERQLGRVEDGTRAEVVRALYLAAGEDARPFLEKQAEKKMAAIRYADPIEVAAAQKDLACILSGLLPSAPGDEHAARLARELLGDLCMAIERSGKRLQLEGTIAAAEAIVRGAALGEVRALAGAIRKVAAIKVEERAPAQARIEALAELARRVADELKT